jgi:quinol monooxygenase YgiN
MTVAGKENKPGIKPVSYELWRQDDNGNRFLIGCYGDRSAAEAHQAELTRVLHKQIYWIDAKTDEERLCCPGGD